MIPFLETLITFDRVVVNCSFWSYILDDSEHIIMGVNYSKNSRFENKIFAVKKNQLFIEKRYNFHFYTDYSLLSYHGNEYVILIGLILVY